MGGAPWGRGREGYPSVPTILVYVLYKYVGVSIRVCMFACVDYTVFSNMEN